MDDHALAATIAREAGELLVRRRAEGATKDDGDRESNELILARLARARPDDAVLSEESKDDPIRLEESGGRLPHARILLLLDRRDDAFIARRADVDAMLVKPVDAGILRRAAQRLLPSAS